MDQMKNLTHFVGNQVVLTLVPSPTLQNQTKNVSGIIVRLDAVEDHGIIVSASDSYAQFRNRFYAWDKIEFIDLTTEGRAQTKTA